MNLNRISLSCCGCNLLRSFDGDLPIMTSKMKLIRIRCFSSSGDFDSKYPSLLGKAPSQPILPGEEGYEEITENMKFNLMQENINVVLSNTAVKRKKSVNLTFDVTNFISQNTNKLIDEIKKSNTAINELSVKIESLIDRLDRQKD